MIRTQVIPTAVHIMDFYSSYFTYSLKLSNTAMLPLTVQDTRLDWSYICCLMSVCLFLIHLLKKPRSLEFVCWLLYLFPFLCKILSYCLFAFVITQQLKISIWLLLFLFIMLSFYRKNLLDLVSQWFLLNRIVSS